MGQSKIRKAKGKYPTVNKSHVAETIRQAVKVMNTDNLGAIQASMKEFLVGKSQKDIDEANKVFFSGLKPADIDPLIAALAMADAIVCGRASIENGKLQVFPPAEHENMIREIISRGHPVLRLR